MFKKPFMLERQKSQKDKLPSRKICELCAGEGCDMEEKRLQSISADRLTRSCIQRGRNVVELLQPEAQA